MSAKPTTCCTRFRYDLYDQFSLTGVLCYEPLGLGTLQLELDLEGAEREGSVVEYTGGAVLEIKIVPKVPVRSCTLLIVLPFVAVRSANIVGGGGRPG